MNSQRLKTKIAGLELASPVLTASGCGGTGRELAQFCELTRLGAFVTTSVMARPRAGRPTPRVAETPSGILTAMGLPGPGVEGFLEHELPWLAEQGVPVVVSVAGNSAEEFAELAARLSGEPGVAAIEVNVACPNVADRGRMFAWHPGAAAAVVRAVRGAAPAGVPVIAKLTPDVTDIVTIALACVDAGADALTLINTVEGMAIDHRTLRPAVTGVSGGLSGPAIRPIALRCVYQVHAALPRTPIIGCGGVATGLDALEYVLAGASAVAVGTTLFHDPGAVPRIARELDEALAARRIERLADAVGLAHRPAGHAPPQVRPATPPPPHTAPQTAPAAVPPAREAAEAPAASGRPAEPDPAPAPAAEVKERTP
ncbi:dihydroorotate dehydrogenase [Actinomadura parmotrematis]|uniref:Dihydroorotate dehydrogenase n=1 Tax=Actinomadura parmotrematis TaxID=2864039 RepID=A0ABS7FKN5_9ACTN|nr:dihydroorotate dehydrogenase [Actinomadura parmotrematis]MBW8480919.1 dihydroorotate dehydrogenase [Actinomadura parmotrematis]